MTLGVGCVKIPGEKPAVPHDGHDNCHDCNVPPGALHHPGCDAERFPNCHGQRISCGCDK